MWSPVVLCSPERKNNYCTSEGPQKPSGFPRKRFGREDISSAYELTAPDTSHRDRELWSAVTDLPDKYKTVLFLYYYKDMTVEEIAKAAGIRRGTVRSQLSRARQLLRQALGGDFDE